MMETNATKSPQTRVYFTRERPMSDRKYRQRGYQENDREREQSQNRLRQRAGKSSEREGPRSPRMMAFGEKVKCASFGARTVVERETSSGTPSDARQAFANLFKK